MPVLMPTPEEFAAQPWATRRTLARNASALVRAYRVADPRSFADVSRPWHEEVVREARELHAAMGADPDAAKHWAQLARESA